jgi:hypothetical protein
MCIASSLPKGTPYVGNCRSGNALDYRFGIEHFTPTRAVSEFQIIFKQISEH